ncbi:hypothetical protein GGTG_06472 [Gaeumannomyces tritici R3-111a-1]|uniref:MYND-type zinc finger protein samB n=1 Tax=Gaeumannomyces tritici (strain R3-111a-1) TaxID=644352 RepID=J3NYX0_GAET3|nr:hypothetical protein GGTG_06472 [Gaeumannomyces tritici R3-111a-1]EJT76553.1 hypothetical protein GGTG_06472 [Gaeumannomyces tritici R3-111a-1]
MENHDKLERFVQLVLLDNEKAMAAVRCIPVGFYQMLEAVVDKYDGDDQNHSLLVKALYFAVVLLYWRGDMARASVVGKRLAQYPQTVQGNDKAMYRIIMEDVEKTCSRIDARGRRPTSWGTWEDDVPRGMDAETFKKWLWRVEGQSIERGPRGLRRRNVFPPYALLPRPLPERYKDLGSFRQNQCFLGEIVSTYVLDCRVMELVDTLDRAVLLYFDTDSRKFEGRRGLLKPGHTVAVLNAEKRELGEGTDTIRHQHPERLKIFPWRLEHLMDVSDIIQEHTVLPGRRGKRKCQGCGAEGDEESMTSCGECRCVWYCNRPCQDHG